MLIPMLHPEVQKPSIFSKSRMGAASEITRASSTSKAIVSVGSGIQDREEDTSTFEATAAKQNFELFDENGEIISIPTGEDKAIRLPTKSMLMYINWSEKALKNYDTQNLENLSEVCKYASAPKRARSEYLSLYTFLDAFLRVPLVPEDMWFSPRCKERRQDSKKLDLWRLPEVLVIHLKRFSFSRSTEHKLETFVNFPIHDLDLTNYVAQKGSPQRQLYELYALSNHYGSMGSGHYTAFIKWKGSVAAKL